MPHRRGHRQKTFTLPDGRTIEIPSPSESNLIQNRDYFEYQECEHNWCCNADGFLEYSDTNADFAYVVHPSAIPFDWLLVLGTIYIDGVPSTNPYQCGASNYDASTSPYIYDCDYACNWNCNDMPSEYCNGEHQVPEDSPIEGHAAGDCYDNPNLPELTGCANGLCG